MAVARRYGHYVPGPHLDDNDAGLLQELFLLKVIQVEHTRALAHELRLSHRFCFLHVCHPNLLCLFPSSIRCCLPNISAVTINHDGHANSLSGGG
jgi:hypothetical protein